MARVCMYGWVEGMQKLELTKTLRAELGSSLSDAKRMTDRVLDEERVLVEGLTQDVAERLARLVAALGVKVVVEDE